MGRKQSGSARARRTLRAIACAALALTFAVPAPALERIRIGRAFDADTGEYVYSEVHLEALEDGRVTSAEVTYLDPAGQPFARNSIDYSRDPLLPDYRLQGEVSGYLESATRAGSSLLVRFREDGPGTPERAALALAADATSRVGLDRFVERHWDALLEHRTLVADFLIPSRLDFTAFRVRCGDDGRHAHDGPVTFVVEPESTLLRLMLPATEVTYDPATREPVRFVGASMRGAGAGGRRVRVDYSVAPDGAPVARVAPD